MVEEEIGSMYRETREIKIVCISHAKTRYHSNSNFAVTIYAQIKDKSKLHL